MPTVDYRGKTVSDENIKTVLQRIADHLGEDVWVWSGDRSHVPKGGAKDSRHLHNQAADISVTHVSLASVYATLKTDADQIFDADKRYEVIHHGEHTNTGGRHIHIGRWSTGSGIKFCTEGLTAAESGKYSCQWVHIMNFDKGMTIRM